MLLMKLVLQGTFFIESLTFNANDGDKFIYVFREIHYYI